MIKRGINAYYIDAKKEIYNEFCKGKYLCKNIITSFNQNQVIIDGDFLEKYLDMILKLKAVIVGHDISSFYNIFYNIEYITFINLGHGIKYFKHFLYNNYTSFKKYNKLVLPPSKKIISLAIKYGWDENNIIKICLPKWDRYNTYKNQFLNGNYSELNKSIFILFTWRNLKDNISYNISHLYLDNIRKLINDDILKREIEKNNITLFFSLHPNFNTYKIESQNIKSIKYISHNDISDCLMKANLLISDFSSIIFDMIYQNKPYIMFIPDANDKEIRYTYEKGYFELIESLKNGSLYFQNIFFNIKETVQKTIYYIENNFILDSKLKKFYDSFELKCNNNTDKFINYLINL